MARSLALVSDPAAPRSVVGVIVPTDRDCQRPSSTNRRTVDRREKSHVSSWLERSKTAGPALLGEKAQKKFGLLEAAEARRRRLAASSSEDPATRPFRKLFP